MDEPSLPVEASFEKDGAQERIPPGELTCGGVGDHGGAVHPAARRRVVEALNHAVNQLADLPVEPPVEGVSYGCNCCGCCCVILRGINKFGI
jgi:hypothetical protein